MNGLTIFSHSFRQVSGNLGMAIKISGWFVAIVVVLFTTLSQTGLLESLDVNGGNVGKVALTVALMILAGLVLLLWAASVVAIAWHRYILLEDIPRGFIPYQKEFQVGRYFWYGIAISLLAVLAVGIISGMLGTAFGPFITEAMQGEAKSLSGAAFLMGFAVGTVVIVLYLRMALVLPAVALNERMTIGQAWRQTSGHSGAIVVLALILAVINLVVPRVISLAMADIPTLNLVLNGVYQWSFYMLSISVLSTLYGHIVQEREVH